MRIIGGVPVDQQDPADSEPTTLAGRAIDTAAPVTKAKVSAADMNTGVPNMPTAADPLTFDDGVQNTSGGSSSTSTTATDSPPLIIPPPTPTVPGNTTSSFIPMPPQTDDIDHTSNPYQTPTEPDAPAPRPMMAAPSAPLDGGTPSTLNPPNLPAGEIQVTGTPPAPDTTTVTTPPIQDTFGSTPAPAPTPTVETPIAPMPTEQETAGMTPSGPAATTPTPSATATPDNSAQQQIVLQLLAQLMGQSSNNVGFADPAAAAGAANPDAGDVGKFLSAQLTPIDPANDLRDKMITPADDDLTEKARQNMADAQSNLSSFDRGTTVDNALKAFSPDASLTGVNTDPSGRLKALQDQVDQATSSLSGVDRQALAKQMYDTWKAETDPQYDLLTRQATQRAAATGGLGSGGLRTDYGNLARVRLNDETNKKNELIQQAISDSVNDALNKQARLAGLEGQLSSEEASRRNEVRTDQDRTLSQFNSNRNFADQFAGEKSGDLVNALNGASGVFSNTANQETNRRQELRGERDYEVGQEKDAFDRALAEHQTEQSDQNNRFGQGLSLLNLASAGNPASVLANLGSQGGDMSSIISQLAAQMGKSSAAAGGSTQTGAGGIDASTLSSLIPLLSGALNKGAASTAGQGIDTAGLQALIKSMGGL